MYVCINVSKQKKHILWSYPNCVYEWVRSYPNCMCMNKLLKQNKWSYPNYVCINGLYLKVQTFISWLIPTHQSFIYFHAFIHYLTHSYATKAVTLFGVRSPPIRLIRMMWLVRMIIYNTWFFCATHVALVTVNRKENIWNLAGLQEWLYSINSLYMLYNVRTPP